MIAGSRAPPRFDRQRQPWYRTSADIHPHVSKSTREQLLVATGLWPMPEKRPLNASVHGKIERHGYTIEKVFFASMAGHYM